MKKATFLILGLMTLFFGGCFSQKDKSSFKLGIDPSFIPLNTMGQESHLYGFCQEFFTQVGNDLSENLELIKLSWDDLLPGLKSGKLDGIVTTLNPYNFYKSEFTFSDPIIKTGPSIVSQIKNPFKNLKALDGKIVGIIAGSEAVNFLTTQSSAVVQTFESPSSLLDALVRGQIDAAMLDYLIAYAYCKDLYSTQLVVSSMPFGDAGIRFMMKNTNKNLTKMMQTVDDLIKSSQTSSSLQKWQLPKKA